MVKIIMVINPNIQFACIFQQFYVYVIIDANDFCQTKSHGSFDIQNVQQWFLNYELESQITQSNNYQTANYSEVLSLNKTVRPRCGYTRTHHI